MREEEIIGWGEIVYKGGVAHLEGIPPKALCFEWQWNLNKKTC